jgi:ubiquinone/menaquinone biosynthesis C-methylase UbiE
MTVNPDGVRAAYDAWAETYDVDRNLTPFTTAIIRNQPLRLSGACVVEIGCGTGANSTWLAEAAERVIAFDFSERMLEQARRRVASDRVRFFRHDVSQPWPIPDQSADVVLDSLVLEHIADLRAVFRETHRVLKPGGSAFVFELHPFNQMAGGQAHFVDRSTGNEVWVPAVRHDVSDYVNSGLVEGLCLTALGEWHGSKAASDTPPILVSLAFQKPASPRADGPGEG